MNKNKPIPKDVDKNASKRMIATANDTGKGKQNAKGKQALNSLNQRLSK